MCQLVCKVMAPAGQIYRLSDRTLGGTLERRLRRWRKDGLSFDRIARHLADEGIDVTGETIRRWCNALQIPDPKAAA